MNLFLRYLFGICLIIYFLYVNDIKKIFVPIKGLNLEVLFACVCIYFFAIYITSIKWFVLLKGKKFYTLFCFTLVGQFYSLILPGQLAGEGIKAYKAGKGENDHELIFASVIFDRLTSLIALFCLFIVGVFTSSIELVQGLLGTMIVGLIFFISLLFMVLFGRIDKFLRPLISFFNIAAPDLEKMVYRFTLFLQSLKMYFKNTKVMFFSVVIGIFYHLIAISIYYILGNAMHLSVPFTDWLWVYGAIGLALLLPFTVAGLGIREAGLIFLLSLLNVSSENALSLSLTIFAIQMTGAFVGGIVDFAWIKKSVRV